MRDEKGREGEKERGREQKLWEGRGRLPNWFNSALGGQQEKNKSPGFPLEHSSLSTEGTGEEKEEDGKETAKGRTPGSS